MNLFADLTRSNFVQQQYCNYLGLRSYFDDNLSNRSNVSWLLILTFPNGGSTALAKIIQTAPKVYSLNGNAEGQWIIPSLCKHGKRWNQKHNIWKRTLRAAWLNKIDITIKDKITIVEKSPPNMCRYKNIVSALQPMEVTLVTFVRNPYATCASWHSRYGLEVIIRDWCPEHKGTRFREDDYFKLLGEIWVDRAKMLIRAREESAFDFTYEDFCENNEQVTAQLETIIPNLSGINLGANIKVKDYKAQSLSNMNERQINSLSKAQIDALTRVFSENAEILDTLRYPIL